MKVATINIAKDFAVVPFGRYPEDGKFNATRFREDFLIPLLKDNDMVQVELSGLSDSVSSSFLNEVFAGLISKSGMEKGLVLQKIEIITQRIDLKDEILSYIKNA